MSDRTVATDATSASALSKPGLLQNARDEKEIQVKGCENSRGPSILTGRADRGVTCRGKARKNYALKNYPGKMTGADF